MSRELIHRILSSAVLIILLLVVLFINAIFIQLIIAIVAGILAFEYAKLLTQSYPEYYSHTYPISFSVIAGVTVFLTSTLLSLPVFNVLSSIVLLLVCMSWLYVFWHLIFRKIITSRKAQQILGICMVLGFSLSLSKLYIVGGAVLFLIPILFTIMVDMGGYIVGRSIGKIPLSSRLSPKKTWEGSIGSFVFAIIFVFILKIFGFFTQISFIATIFLVAVGVVIASLGDLYQSWLKRISGVKNSGDFIPGHGGIFDRIDGLVAFLPFYTLFYLYINY